MVRSFLASSVRMALAGRAGHEQIVGRYLRPIGLMQILACVFGVGVIRRVHINSGLPVVGGPYDINAGLPCAFGVAAQAGE